MSDPPRLTELQGGLAAELIESARDDGPPMSARHRAIAALGTGTGVLLVASSASGGAATASTGVAAGSVAGSGTAKTAAVATWSMVTKWVGGGAVAAALTASAVATFDAHTAHPRANDSALEMNKGPIAAPSLSATRPWRERATNEPPPTNEPPAMVSAPPAPPELPSLAPMAPRAIPREANREATASRGVAESSDLVSEVAALDRVREAVTEGASERALRALDDYDRRFAGGWLALESQVLRVEALARKGDRQRATRLAETFLVQNPSSAHAARMRSLLALLRKDRAP